MHPLVQDLTNLKDEELQKNYSNLVSRLNQSFRMGNSDLIHQIQLIMEDYSTEIQKRQREQLEKNIDSKKLDKLIDIK